MFELPVKSQKFAFKFKVCTWGEALPISFHSSFPLLECTLMFKLVSMSTLRFVPQTTLRSLSWTWTIQKNFQPPDWHKLAKGMGVNQVPEWVENDLRSEIIMVGWRSSLWHWHQNPPSLPLCTPHPGSCVPKVAHWSSHALRASRPTDSAPGTHFDLIFASWEMSFYLSTLSVKSRSTPAVSPLDER